MNETPTPDADAEATIEAVSRRQQINSIIVIALVVVGVVGTAAMLYQLYGSSEPVKATQSTKESPKAASPVAPGLKSGFALRLPPFSDVATAEDLRAKLGAQQIPSSLSVEAKVQVGPFKTKDEAEAARAKLKQLGIYGGELVTIK
jgi:hypothetical protein